MGPVKVAVPTVNDDSLDYIDFMEHLERLEKIFDRSTPDGNYDNVLEMPDDDYDNVIEISDPFNKGA